MNTTTAPTRMTAGTQTGSLMNHVISGMISTPPEIGMGATILGWTDRRPATVVAVARKGKIVGIKEDNAERVDSNGMSEDQEYIFTPNPAATTVWYSFRPKINAYVRVGDSIKGGRLMIGKRAKYHDHSF